MQRPSPRSARGKRPLGLAKESDLRKRKTAKVSATQPPKEKLLRRRLGRAKACGLSGPPESARFGNLPVQDVADFPSNEICQELESMVERGRWPGFAACAFVGRGEKLDTCALTCARGKADMQLNSRMGFDTICRLYSMTKAFVGLGIAKLADRGRLALDDPAWWHLPEPVATRFREMRVLVEGKPKPVPAASPITLRQLLTHTSGMGSDIATGLDALTRKRGPWEALYQDLTEAVDEGRVQSLAAFVEALSELPLWQHPGKEFYYSYGYDVLGYILEHKSGLKLNEFLKKEIFLPLGMHDTGFFVQRRDTKRLAQLYRHTKATRFGSTGTKAELCTVKNGFLAGQHCRVLSGGGCVSSRDGGLTSTLRDYSKFLVAVFNKGAIPGSNKRLCSKRAAELMLTNHCAEVAGCRRTGEPRICAHNRRGVGLNLMGEVQLDRCEPDKNCLWFDGVPGLVQWGGAATTFYKYQEVNGKPLLLILFAQVLPQDDGRTCSAAFQRMRAWAESETASRKRKLA